MKIGITGSRKGTSYDAMVVLRAILHALKPVELHHGDCVGVDSEAHSNCRSVSIGTKIVIHPPFDDTFRAYRNADDLRGEKDYLARNHNIVKECDMIIAMPDGPEKQRSGTWSTARKAIRLEKIVLIIHPDGSREWK